MKAICNVTITSMREKAEEKSAMISQLLYGEKVEVLKQKKGFSQVVTAFDEIVAWVDSRHIHEVSEEDYANANIKVCQDSFYATHKVGQQLILLGSELIGQKEEIQPVVDNIVQTAYNLLHTPYLLGGKSVMGFDASGFVQMVFKVNGVSLPREAKLQAEKGESLFFVGENQPGDIAFFEDESGQINHVGVMLEDSRVIHAYDRVRIDQLDSTGIYNTEEKKYTHRLRFIKRVLTN